MLEIKAPYKIVACLDEDKKGVSQMDTPGGKQKLTVVNESGLYGLLFAMKPQKARGVNEEYIHKRQGKLRLFKRWVTHEVLPSIQRYRMEAWLTVMPAGIFPSHHS